MEGCVQCVQRGLCDALVLSVRGAAGGNTKCVLD